MKKINRTIELCYKCPYFSKENGCFICRESKQFFKSPSFLYPIMFSPKYISEENIEIYQEWFIPSFCVFGSEMTKIYNKRYNITGKKNFDICQKCERLCVYKKKEKKSKYGTDEFCYIGGRENLPKENDEFFFSCKWINGETRYPVLTKNEFLSFTCPESCPYKYEQFLTTEN